MSQFANVRTRTITFLLRVSLSFAFIGSASSAGLPTLGHTLREAGVPTDQFEPAELNQRITSFALNQDDPFLLAYYVDDGSNLLKPPLRVVRYDRESRKLSRSDLRDIHSLFQGTVPMDCLGSALQIVESHGLVYIDTHLTPSAGCLIVLNPSLSIKTALSGWLIGLIGAEYAIVEGSEIHFMSVQPLHIQVFDLKHERLVPVYPYENDPFRDQYSNLIAPRISDAWCQKVNAQCDPKNFDVGIENKIAVNEAAKVFGFMAAFDASGFGEDAEAHVPPARIAYFFREHNGAWEHRAFEATQLNRLFQAANVFDLVEHKPEAVFQTAAR